MSSQYTSSQQATSSDTSLAHAVPPGSDLSLMVSQMQQFLTQQDRISKYNATSRKVTSIFRQQGRHLRRLVSLHDSLDDMLAEANRRARAANAGVSLTHTDQENGLYQAYHKLVQWIPSISEVPQVDMVYALQQLTLGADSARADDTHRLKGWVVNWLMRRTPAPEPGLTTEDKSGRGFHNEATGRLLCPVDYDWNNAIHQQNIRNYHPAFMVTADSWPAFLYADGQCDANDLDKGLFQAQILVKAFKAIFTAPSSSEGGENVSLASSLQKRSRGDRRTRSHVAMLAGMKSVEPRAIAYVACQLRFALSSVASWAIRDGLFDYREFHTAIVEWFEGASTTEAKKAVEELLLWWNRQVFGPTFAFNLDRDRSGQKSVAMTLKRRRISTEGETAL